MNPLSGFVQQSRVTISVVLMSLNNLVLHYWIDENGRSCKMTDAEKQDSL